MAVIGLQNNIMSLLNVILKSLCQHVNDSTKGALIMLLTFYLQPSHTHARTHASTFARTHNHTHATETRVEVPGHFRYTNIKNAFSTETVV